MFCKVYKFFPESRDYTKSWQRSQVREAAKNISRGGSLNLAAFGREVLTPPNFTEKVTYPLCELKVCGPRVEHDGGSIKLLLENNKWRECPNSRGHSRSA